MRAWVRACVCARRLVDMRATQHRTAPHAGWVDALLVAERVHDLAELGREIHLSRCGQQGGEEAVEAFERATWGCTQSPARATRVEATPRTPTNLEVNLGPGRVAHAEVDETLQLCALVTHSY
jgi:hypothetical protein